MLHIRHFYAYIIADTCAGVLIVDVYGEAIRN